jgi:hypothetical protein
MPNIAIFIIAVAAMLSIAGPAFAQGFMVKPMRMEVSAAPGQSVEIPLQIRNSSGSDVRAVDVRLVELTQTTTGSWNLIEPDAETDFSKLASSRAWTTLSASRAAIAPLEPAEVLVRVQIPFNARGYYFAGIVVETPIPESVTGVFVRTRFLIPLIVEIQGRPVRQQIALDDVVMIFDETEGAAPTTKAHLRIENRGQTFSRIRGQIGIERKSGDRWRPVTRIAVPERSIIPGMTFELGDDLRRRLPSGDYRLRGELYVDGRRIAPLEKEIAFAGDPNVDGAAYDTALILEPGFVGMDIAPGATRTTVVRIENPGDDPVEVSASALTPRGLIGVEMGELSGVALSAEPWTIVQPSTFTIRPRGRQNIRVISRIPREGVDHANYYAELALTGQYADGQSAGETRSTVHLANRQIDGDPTGAVEQLTLAQGDEPDQYFVQIRFANLGNVHVDPLARAYVLNPQGTQLRSVALSGDEGMLLPLGKRNFSGELNLAGLEPGYYALRGTVAMTTERSAARQQVIQVADEEITDENGEKSMARTVTLLDAEAVEQLDEADIPAADGSPSGMELQGAEPALFGTARE